MMVSSLLAFNACTKDGAQGPAGPKGDAGAPGAAGAVGPVGPAGAKGADGVTIRSGDAAPAASVGNDGDFYFDKTAKVLYGPKADGAWPATGTTLTGPAGKAGSSFLAGAAAPTAATGNVGDFYFSTDESTFYGPKAEDGSWVTLNKIDISAKGAKSIYYTVGLSDIKVKAGTQKVYGDEVAFSKPVYRLDPQVKLILADVERKAAYPGWVNNREMAFESVPLSGVFDVVGNTLAIIQAQTLNTRFIYTGDTNPTPMIFAWNANDIATFSATAAAINTKWEYLVYGQIDPATAVKVGDNPIYAEQVTVTATKSTTDFMATYTARSTFDLNKIVPNLEKLKQEGAYISVRYKTVDAVTGNINHTAGPQLGWFDLTPYVTSYSIKGSKYGPNDAYETVDINTAASLGAFVLPTTTIAGNTINSTTLVTTGTQATGLGRVTVDYDFSTGSTAGLVYAGPETHNYVPAAPGVPAHYTVTPRLGGFFYSQNGNHLVSSVATGNGSLNGADYIVGSNKITGGKDEAFFAAQPLLLFQIVIVEADQIKAAQKAGINIEDADALERFISKR